jgi:hypothetical protein
VRKPSKFARSTGLILVLNTIAYETHTKSIRVQMCMKIIIVNIGRRRTRVSNILNQDTLRKSGFGFGGEANLRRDS